MIDKTPICFFQKCLYVIRLQLFFIQNNEYQAIPTDEYHTNNTNGGGGVRYDTDTGKVVGINLVCNSNYFRGQLCPTSKIVCFFYLFPREKIVIFKPTAHPPAACLTLTSGHLDVPQHRGKS